MNRDQWEHVIAAAATVSGQGELVVVGSQAILGSFPDAPEALLRSQEADIFPRHAPEKAIEIDGALGDGSQFHRANGYYAHGVGPETAKAPVGWEDRLVVVEIPARPGSTNHPTAYCLEPHDLVLAKCAAGRERDWEFAAGALGAGLVDPNELLRRCEDLPLSAEASTARPRQPDRDHRLDLVAVRRWAPRVRRFEP